MITVLMICHAFTCVCTIILFLCVVSLKNRNMELETKIEYLESVCSQTAEICTKNEVENKMVKELIRLHQKETSDKITKAYFQGYERGKNKK